MFSVLEFLMVGLVACNAATPIVPITPASGARFQSQDIQLIAERRLAEGGWESFQWSPDSAWMLLSLPERKSDGIANDGSLAIVDVKSNKLYSLPRPGQNPVWSPDSSSIVFTSMSQLNGARQFWLYRSSDQRLSHLPELPGTPVLWLADGRLICSADDGLWATWLNLSSTDTVTLGQPQPLLLFDTKDPRRWAVPNRDGSAIVLYDGTVEDARHMWMVRPEGKRIEFDQPRGSLGTCCAWSPEGSHFAFFSPQPLYGIYVVDRTGYNRRRVLPAFALGEGFLISMGLSPDGQVIAFEWSAQGEGAPFGNTQIYLVNLDGSNVRQLTPESSKPHRWLRWSPDGKYIAFQQMSGQVWVAEVKLRNE